MPTAFSDISEFEVVCEVEEKDAGYNPELSYGSHIFQDLVEADILYTAIFTNEKTKIFSPKKLNSHKNIVDEFSSDKDYSDIINVYDLSCSELTLDYDLEKNHLMLHYD